MAMHCVSKMVNQDSRGYCRTPVTRCETEAALEGSIKVTPSNS